LLFSVIGGAVADIYSRRLIVMFADTLAVGCGVTLAVASFTGSASLTLIYALVMLLGVVSAFDSPSSQAILPGLVRPETFASAVTVHSVSQTIGAVSGPFFAGLLIDAAGIGT